MVNAKKIKKELKELNEKAANFQLDYRYSPQVSLGGPSVTKLESDILTVEFIEPTEEFTFKSDKKPELVVNDKRFHFQ